VNTFFVSAGCRLLDYRSRGKVFDVDLSGQPPAPGAAPHF
jgi:hypothetical protein